MAVDPNPNPESTCAPPWAYCLHCGGQNEWPPLYRVCSDGEEPAPELAPIVIVTPFDGTTVNVEEGYDASVVTGTGEPNETIYVDGDPVIVDENGDWFWVPQDGWPSGYGTESYTITATDNAGRSDTRSFTVTGNYS